VVNDVRIGQVTWDQIAAGRIREGLTKAAETEDPEVLSFASSTSVTNYLEQKKKDGFLIALVETFGWVPKDSWDAQLARDVNDKFLDKINRSEKLGPTFFLDKSTDSNMTASYLSSRIDTNTARINIFFVRRSSECPSGD